MEAFDAHKTRKVLERVEKFLGILIRENLVKDAPFLDEGELENESDLADDVWEVLQMQLRQCDVGTAEEQLKRWRKFCAGQVDCVGCPYNKGDGISADCFANWAQTPCAAEEGDGDGGK